MSARVEVFRREPAIIAESPFWDASRRRLVWTDISNGLLHLSPLGGAENGDDDEVHALEPPLACIQPAAGGGMVAGLGDRVVLLADDGTVTRQLDETPLPNAGMRLNEGKCDPFGRFVVGAMNTVTGEADASVYSVTADGGARPIAGGFGITNGFEWSDDGTSMFLADTSVKTVYRAAYLEDGSLGELVPFLTGHSFDGAARDVDGCLWTALNGESGIARWTPEGELDTLIELPAPAICGVAFGGDDLGLLFVGTAREKMTEEQLEEHPLSGSMLVIEGTGTAGRPPGVFAR